MTEAKGQEPRAIDPAGDSTVDASAVKKHKLSEKKSGEYMMSAPIIHTDEMF